MSRTLHKFFLPAMVVVGILAVTQLTIADESAAKARIAECAAFGTTHLARADVVVSDFRILTHKSPEAGINLTGFASAAQQAADAKNAGAPTLGVSILHKGSRVEIAWAKENQGVMLVYDKAGCNSLFDVIAMQRKKGEG